jgi:hypothetical protein
MLFETVAYGEGLMSRLRSRLERLESRHNQDDEMVLVGPLPDEFYEKLAEITGRPLEEIKRDCSGPHWVRQSPRDGELIARLRARVAEMVGRRE